MLCLLATTATTWAQAQAAQQTRYIVYYNSDASPLDALLETPYTHVILSFLTARWENDTIIVDEPERISPFWDVVPKLQAQGKKVLISFGGGDFQSAQYADLAGHESVLAERIASVVRQRGLDGVDIDYEASDSFFKPLPRGVLDGRRFVIALQQALRRQLPAPCYLISHAPQPPYLDRAWHGGAYLDVLAATGAEIDWIAVQYYDNPGFDEPAASQVVGTATSPFATAYRALVGELQTAGGQYFTWAAEKLVVGKPIFHADASHGHIPPAQVIDDILRPLQLLYGDAFGGLMGWQFSTLTADHRAWNRDIAPVLFAPLVPGADM